MPMYGTICTHCGRKDTVYRSVANRDKDLPLCPDDDFPVRRAVEAPAVHADLPGYQSPIDGRWVEGRRARTEDLKRSNCRPWEGMETERREAVKRAEEADRDFDAKTEAAVHETFNAMSAESQRALAQL